LFGIPIEVNILLELSTKVEPKPTALLGPPISSARIVIFILQSIYQKKALNFSLSNPRGKAFTTLHHIYIYGEYFEQIFSQAPHSACHLQRQTHQIAKSLPWQRLLLFIFIAFVCLHFLFVFYFFVLFSNFSFTFELR